MYKFVVVYGYGTPSAYVRRTVMGKAAAERALRAAHTTWGGLSHLYSLHLYKDVVLEEKPDRIVLIDAAYSGGRLVMTVSLPHQKPRTTPFVMKAS
jgi:hypothetical protein